MKFRKPVAVLGCGPAGLLAAWAAHSAGREIVILSMKKKSPIGGAQYLHRNIPGLTGDKPTDYITHKVAGTEGGYQSKAYGNGVKPGFVSFSHVNEGMLEPAWNLRGIYDTLWSFFEDRINDVRLDADWLAEHRQGFGLIISSVPKKSLCIHHDLSASPPTEGNYVPHRFDTQQIQIYNKCLPGGPEGPDNTLYYDGTDAVSWYRASNIFGTGSTEWGGHVELPFPASDLVKVWKPVFHNCTCWTGMRNLMFVGRFGEWRKGVLTHHAYEDVARRLQ